VKGLIDPASYDAWYHTPRGRWIGEQEFTLLEALLTPDTGATLLDVGCGTGHFSRLFAQSGLQVTGIDADAAALNFARRQGGQIDYIQGSALELPFPDNAFDYTTAVTSFCFIDDPVQALQEMWRVTRCAVAIGLLNRHSLLYRKKHGHGSYAGARWDTAAEVRREWVRALLPPPREVTVRSAVFLPGGGGLARWSERLLPNRLLVGGFLALGLNKPSGRP